MKWVMLGGAVVAEVTGSLSLSLAARAPAWYALVAVGYLVAFSLLAGVLRRGLPIGVVYGIWGASGVALTALLGAALLGDPLTPLMLAGLVLIVGGVVAIEIGRQHAPAGTSAEEVR